MKQKTLAIECDANMARQLGLAIRAFAHAAYPEGGSECAQVARETLLDTASSCDGHRGGRLILRRRQLSQLRTAVDWYAQDAQAMPAGVSVHLLALLDVP